MNRSTTRSHLVVAALLWLAISLAGSASELNVPNTFSAGTRASAAQVNQNFDATETAVNNNNARLGTAENDISNLQTRLTTIENQIGSSGTNGGMPVYSGGQLIGTALSVGLDTTSSYQGAVITPTGFLVKLNLDSGEVRGLNNVLFFSELNCQGQAYMQLSSWEARQGTVVWVADAVPPRLFYIARKSTLGRKTILSRYTWTTTVSNAYCANRSAAADIDAYDAFPNDPNVTGVPSIGYQVPILFGLP